MVEPKDCKLRISGMDCPSCAMNVKNAVKKLDGVSDISVNFITRKAAIKHDPSRINTSQIIGAIKNTGYTAIEDGKEINHEVSCSSCAADIFEEKPPIDGIVISGESSVNQASITGESMPVHKKIGDQVYAGTLNEHGYLEIKVSRRSEETVISKIVKMVEEAERKKSPTEKFVDKFARYYTPAVILLAVGVATIPGLVFEAF